MLYEKTNFIDLKEKKSYEIIFKKHNTVIHDFKVKMLKAAE